MKALALAFGFLSWLPVPSVEAGARDLGRAVALFPVVGLAFGALLWGLISGVHGHLPPLVAGGLGVGLLAWLSGGLHLDGLSDTFDAVGASTKPDPVRRREKMLEVMRDPRAGPHGAAALVVALGLKAAALGAVVPGPALMLGPALARWAASLLVVAFPYARPDGLGRVFVDEARAWQVGLVGLGLGGALVAVGPQASLSGLVAVAAAVLLAARLRRHLGGLTGDVYGAGVELAEALFFVGMSALMGK